MKRLFWPVFGASVAASLVMWGVSMLASKLWSK